MFAGGVRVSHRSGASLTGETLVGGFGWVAARFLRAVSIRGALVRRVGARAEELIKAGVYIEAEGLDDPGQGVVVDFSGEAPVVTDGPYTVGTITVLSVTDQQLTVRSDEDEDIVDDFDELDELDELRHAYAITVHRSQGSEYPVVVVPLTMSAYTLLQRNLLYTAVTRAKRLVVLAGSRKALAIAVRPAGTGRRHTALTHRLQNPTATRP